MVFEGQNKVGLELLGGPREWVNWIAEESGKEIRKLSETEERGAKEWEGKPQDGSRLSQSCLDASWGG